MEQKTRVTFKSPQFHSADWNCEKHDCVIRPKNATGFNDWISLNYWKAIFLAVSTLLHLTYFSIKCYHGHIYHSSVQTVDENSEVWKCARQNKLGSWCISECEWNQFDIKSKWDKLFIYIIFFLKNSMIRISDISSAKSPWDTSLIWQFYGIFVLIILVLVLPVITHSSNQQAPSISQLNLPVYTTLAPW